MDIDYCPFVANVPRNKAKLGSFFYGFKFKVILEYIYVMSSPRE